jgi:FlgD Ig-like domain
MRLRALWFFPAVWILLASSPLHAGTIFDWSKSFGDEEYQYSRSVAIDGSGSIFLSGSINGAVNFGGGPLPYAFSDISLAKFDVNGNHLWSKRFGDFFNQNPQALATDGSGNVIISGFYGGSVDFGGGTLTSLAGANLFLAKFDASGNYIWSKSFGDTLYSSEDGMWVATDASDNVIVTAEFDGTIDFGGGALTSAGSLDIAVAKFDAAGNHIWSKNFGDASFQIPQDVATDGFGNVVITGYFGGSADFGGGPLMSGGLDMFVAELDSGGNHLWSKNFGGALGYSVATDGLGNVVTTGLFNGTVDFGGGPLTEAGGGDIFVAKFDLNGNHLWSKTFGNADFQYCQSVATDGANNVVITASFPGTVDFGGGPLTSAGYDDIFVAKLDANGNHLWSQRFGDADWSDTSTSVAADGSGNIAITGYFPGTVDFGGGPLTSAGGQDIFLARFINDEPIPVLITSFNAIPRNGSITVTWGVRSDGALQTYTLYRHDDTHPHAIVVVGGAFNSSVRSYVDRSVEPGNTYHYELLIHTQDGNDIRSTMATVTMPRLQATLGQNYPNPFRPETSIEYTLGERSNAVVGIYDAIGRLVVRLDQGAREAGTYRAEWNGRDTAGHVVGSGVYFYRLEGVPNVAPKKMVRLK